MIDGKYNINIDTPFGRKPGTVALRTEGEKVIANIDAPVVGKLQTEGRLEGDGFAAEGTFKLKLVGNVTYSLHGTVVDDNLKISINSSKGKFELAGTRA